MQEKKISLFPKRVSNNQIDSVNQKSSVEQVMYGPQWEMSAGNPDGKGGGDGDGVVLKSLRRQKHACVFAARCSTRNIDLRDSQAESKKHFDV